MTRTNITELDDCFRRKLTNENLVASPSVRSLLPEDQLQLLKLIQNFDNFNEENDPCDEHDIGIVEFKGFGSRLSRLGLLGLQQSQQVFAGIKRRSTKFYKYRSLISIMQPLT
jgi:hypothetical protein